MKARTCFALVLSCTLATAVVHADPSTTDKAAAQALFDEARGLMARQKYAEACPKFASSQRLDPGGGTLLNLATCHEKLGKVATAWAEYNEALSLAIRDNRRDRIVLAQQRIAALEPQLPRVTIKVADSTQDGLEVRLDDAPLARAIWGNATPIDPGEHTVSASASKRLPFKTSITIQLREQRTLDVPPLAEDPSAVQVVTPPPPPIEPPKKVVVEPVPPPPPVEDNSGRRTVGVLIGAVGVAGIGVGSIFGLRAFSKWSDSNKGCPGGVCTTDGASAASDARTAARIADVAFAVGIVGLGVGTYLFVTSPSSPTKVGVRVAPSTSGGALVVDGAW